MVSGLDVYGMENLRDVVDFFNGIRKFDPVKVDLLEIFSGEIAFIGVVGAFMIGLYFKRVNEWLVTYFKEIHTLLVNKWYVDELYEKIIINPLRVISQSLFKIVDRILIDGSCDSAADLVQVGGATLRKIQTGKLTFYLSAIFAGNILLLGLVYWLVMVGV